jgi:hypothetical protein
MAYSRESSAWSFAREVSGSEPPPPPFGGQEPPAYDPAWGFELGAPVADIFQAQPRPAVPPPQLITRTSVSSVSFTADVMEGSPNRPFPLIHSASASFDDTSCCCLCLSAPRYVVLFCACEPISPSTVPLTTQGEQEHTAGALRSRLLVF